MNAEAQMNANRANAPESTVPLSPEGKAAVSESTLNHGLLAKEAVVVGEDLDDFELYRAQLRAELAPAGMVESLLAERIVGLFWRLQRAERFHTATFDMLYLQCTSDPQNKRWQPAPGPDGADPIFGLTAVKDFSQTKVLERLLVYERRMEYSLYRTMAELQKQRLLREAGATAVGSVPGRADPDVSRVKMESQAASLPTSDFKIGAVSETPEGVGTNVPEAQEPLCETKPIGDVPMAKAVAEATAPSGTGILPVGSDHGQDGDPKRDLSRLGTHAHGTEPHDGVTTNVPEAQEPVCETKPIGEGIRDQGSGVSDLTAGGIGVQSSGVSDLTPDPRPLTTEPSCETKPISERRIRDGEGYRPIFRRRRCERSPLRHRG